MKKKREIVMTKSELKMVLKLIDNHILTKYAGYYQTEVNYMDEESIKQLKQDIKDLFEEVEDK